MVISSRYGPTNDNAGIEAMAAVPAAVCTATVTT